MASIQKTETGYRVFVCKLGVRDSATFTKDEKVKARQWGTTREAEIIAGAKAAKARGGHTVKHVIEEFMRGPLLVRESSEWELGRCKWFLRNLPFLQRHIRALEVEDVEEWIAERSGEVTGSAVNRDLQLLGPIFEWAKKKKKWVDTNVIHAAEWLENNERRSMRISQADADAIIAALGYVRGTQPVTKRELLAVAFLLAIETGMRRGEMLKTEWRYVHDVFIHLPAPITKSRKKRDVSLTPEARRLIALLPRDGKTLLGELTADTADSLFREARKIAKLPDLHFHDTRHEAVTRLARKLEVLPLSRTIGHENLNSLKTYYEASPEEISGLLDDE